MKTALVTLCLILNLGLSAVAASPLDLPIENPATKAVQELNENNIEQALADKDAEVKTQSLGGGTEKSAAITAQTKESDIPVQLEATKGSAAEGNPLTKLTLGLLVVLGLCFAAWVGLKKYQFKNKGANSAMQMKVLSQFHLGPKRSLAIVRVAGESMLIGVTDHHISLIKSLSLLDEDVPEETTPDFGQVFGKSYASQKSIDEGEEFAISGIKDFVSSRLKNMRSHE